MMKPSLIMTAMALVLCADAWAGWNAAGGEKDEAMGLVPDLGNGRQIYVLCANCHMPEGWGSKDGKFPQLAGQHPNVLIKQLADIRAVNRDTPTMYPFALPESIGDAQALADVVAYIRRLPMDPDHDKGAWAVGSPEYAEGQRLYEDNCIQCHMAQGEGSNEAFYPRLQGQHYNYMLRQLIWIRDGKRRNANPDMAQQVKRFSEREMELVINYVSHLPVEPKDLAPAVTWKNPDFAVSR